MTKKEKNDKKSKKIKDFGGEKEVEKGVLKSVSTQPQQQPPTKSQNTAPKLYARVVPLLKPTKCVVPEIDNIVPINYDSNPIIINNEHFTGYAVFRVQNFNGHNPIDPETGRPMECIPTSDYFNGHRRTFSLQVSGRFRKEWTADEVLFGTFFQKPVHLPPGYKIALALAKKIDASMDGDLSLQEPYMCSPMICAMNILRADPVIRSSSISEFHEDECVFSHDAETTDLRKPLYLPKWNYSGGKHIEENFMETVPSWPESKLRHGNTIMEEEDSDPLKGEADEDITPQTAETKNKTKRSGSLMGFFSRTSSTSEQCGGSGKMKSVTPTQRRSWFLNPEHRRSYKFHPDTLYTFDFNNQYVDLNKMQLKLGISFDVSYYLNGQPVRYQMKSRDGTVIFFTIELGLA